MFAPERMGVCEKPADYNRSVRENDAEPKVMDIRQLREEKPKLGWLTEVRFSILHNHRKLTELEPLVSAYLKANGPVKVVTRENLFEFRPDGDRVDLII